MYMILDTETTGLPITPCRYKFYSISDTEKYDTSRVIQVAWVVCDEYGEIKDTHTYYVSDSPQSSKEALEIHGITQEKCKKEGIPMKEIAKRLNKDLMRCKLFIGHSVSFDVNVLMSEFFRREFKDSIKLLYNIKKFCTMLMKVDGRKSRSLRNTYLFCFGEEFEGAHDALADVMATKKCYFHLHEKK